MDAPVYFYYKLSNYYQNHRRYVKSRSDTQLMGERNPDVSTCDPWENDPATGKPLYPCGLIAGSFFVDRFNMQVKRGVNTIVDGKWWEDSPNWQKSGIAWKSDKDDKFKVNEEMYNSPDFAQSVQYCRHTHAANHTLFRTAQVLTFARFVSLCLQQWHAWREASSCRRRGFHCLDAHCRSSDFQEALP